jgi:hypothetical protein
MILNWTVVNRLVLPDFGVFNLKICGYAWGLAHFPRRMELLPALRPSDLAEFPVQFLSLSLWRSLFTCNFIQWLRDFSPHSIFMGYIWHCFTLGQTLLSSSQRDTDSSGPAYLGDFLYSQQPTTVSRFVILHLRPALQLRLVQWVFPKFHLLFFSLDEVEPFLAYFLYCILHINPYKKIFSSYCAVIILPYSCNKRGNVLINVLLRHIFIIIMAAEKL